MKRYILSLLSLVVLAACSSYDESIQKPIDETTDNNNIVEKYFVYANIDNTSNTRVDITPSTNAGGNPIIKVNWEESGEKFWVYRDYELTQEHLNDNPYLFTQVPSSNKFEGDIKISDKGYSAFYNCSLSLGQSGTHTHKMNYDMSEQNGTGDKVLMMGESQDETGVIDFDHLGFILKPTFMFREAGETTPKDMDAFITKIEMENVQYVNTTNGLSTSQTITVTPSELDDIFIFLPKLQIYPYATTTNANVKVQYNAGHTFTFKVTTNDGKEYTAKPLTLPASPTLEAGKFYTATIELAETRCYLPTGRVFKKQLVDCIKSHNEEHPDDKVYGISFEANSNIKGTELKGSSDSPVSGSPAYFVVKDHYIEIHSAAKTFVFNSDCSNMFSYENDATQILTEMSYVYFTNCDTSLVKDMSQMFSRCYKLINFCDFNFVTSNVENMNGMFFYCGNDDKTLGDFDAYLNLSSFNTKNVKSMKQMFYKYRGISLDISNFDMSNVETVENMFENTSHLKTLKLGDFNIIPDVCTMTNMFLNTGSSLGTDNKTQIYVNSQSVKERLEDSGKTGINSNYAVVVTPQQQ